MKFFRWPIFFFKGAMMMLFLLLQVSVLPLLPFPFLLINLPFIFFVCALNFFRAPNTLSALGWVFILAVGWDSIVLHPFFYTALILGIDLIFMEWIFEKIFTHTSFYSLMASGAMGIAIYDFLYLFLGKIILSSNFLNFQNRSLSFFFKNLAWEIFITTVILIVIWIIFSKISNRFQQLTSVN